MPGLFGIVATDGASDAHPSLFERMAQCLRHYPDERLDTFTDQENGVCLGRMGLGHVHPAAWPKGDSTPALFVGGALTSAIPELAPQSDALQVIQNLRGFYTAVLHRPGETILAVDRHSS
jgi:hypothetical protein